MSAICERDEISRDQVLVPGQRIDAFPEFFGNEILNNRQEWNMHQLDTIEIEDKYMVSFYKKKPLSIERGDGVNVWDEQGKEYLDFTSGWAVTSLGHSHDVIVNAIAQQSKKIVHNPNGGMTYSPARAGLLMALQNVLPSHLNRVFFTNSGSEANDAAIKLARKITGRKKVVSALKSFHGRTIGTVSACGQNSHTDRFNVLLPHYEFVTFNDIYEVESVLDDDTAAVIIEPVQGEGGVRIPDQDYLRKISAICKKNGSLLIVDEIQTGFFRTGPAFISCGEGINVDFLTMAKGIAGGYPFGAVAVTEEIASKISYGDHGGTYIGNPLGCAIAESVINFMVSSKIETHVRQLGEMTLDVLNQWKSSCPQLIEDVRGKGLLLAIEFKNEACANAIVDQALQNGLILNQIHGKIIRIIPALTITIEEMIKGLTIIRKAMHTVMEERLSVVV